MTFFPQIDKWFVPDTLLSASLTEMRQDGRRGNEGICLWLGTRDDTGVARVLTLVKLRGSYIRKSPANIQIRPELMREVHEAARNHDLILVGQIHSHGEYYGVGLSPVDLAYGISVPFFLSVVAPEYATNSKTDWVDCGVHIYLPGTGYTRVRQSEIAARVVVDPTIGLAEITISKND